MNFDEEDKELENEDLENSYYDSAYNDDLERLDNPYFDEDYDTSQDTDRLQNDFYDDNELLNDEKPEEGNPAFGRTKVNGPIKNVKGVANSKLIAFLKSHPWILGGVAIFIFFIVIALLVFQMDFDLVGIGQPNPSYYPDTPSCGKVFLTWENPAYTEARQKVEVNYVPISDASLVDLEEEDQYGKRYIHKEYEYNTYISGIVWNDNDKALDIDNEIVYQAMAVVTRSKLLSELPDNCVVLKNYNEQAKSFVELEGDEEKYNEIINAVNASRGMIMVRNGDIVPAEYDTFLYTKKREEEDGDQSRVYYYHMGHRNKEETQRIHAAWVDDLEKLKEEEIPKEKINDWEIKEMTSLSLYGAKYYIEKINVKYNLYRILKYYFGQDIEFYTIDKNFVEDNSLGVLEGGSGCMWWPVGSNQVTTIDGVNYASGTPASTRVTSPFGYRGGVTGVANATKYHKAIDIGGGNEGGTNINIIAAADGKVISMGNGCAANSPGCGGGLGNFVKLQHSDGTITRYGHMSAVFVRTGEIVKQGQILGKMGSTGNSSGVHLDFQVVVNGTPVNPLNYVSASQPRKECITINNPGIVNGNNNTQTICMNFKNNGYSDEAVAGIMGNLQAESGFNPLIVNSIGCSGIAQWCNTKDSKRLSVLKSTYGSNWNLLSSQINFMLYEINNLHSVKNYLNESHSARDMAYHFCMNYEIPGVSSCNSGTRQNYADGWLDYVKNGCQ